MGITDFWKTKTPQLPSAEQLEEQKKKEAEELARKLNEELEKQNKKDLEDRLENLDRFPGSLNEYIALKREEGLGHLETIVPMSTGRPEKFVYDTKKSTNYTNWIEDEEKLLFALIGKGCVGLIRYTRTDWNRGQLFYGIPVKIKNNAPYR